MSRSKRLYLEFFMAFVLWSGIRRGVLVASSSQKPRTTTVSSTFSTVSTITRLGNVAFLHKSNRTLSFYSVTTRWFSGGDREYNETLVLAPAAIATVDLPFREFGYRSAPFSWEELKQIIVHDKQLTRLSRSVQVERRYKKEREELSKQYVTIYDHILHTKFKFERRLDADTGKWKAFRPQGGDSASFTISLVKNDYPYFVEPGIEHWVLWKLHSEISSDDVAQALEDLKLRYADVLDIIWWENPPALKSLPDINHIHVLVRRESNLK